VRWRFGDFVLDSETRQLRRAGREIHLQPRAFDLLEVLLRERPRALAGARIRARLWPDAIVTDASLHVAVSDLRTALGEDAKAPRYIRTVRRFGYAFGGDVTEEDAAPASSRGARSAARVIWEQKTLPLEEGENVLGRDEDVSVRIDAPSVSRHHARIVVDGADAVLEDLGSKNGTFLKEEKVSAPVPLHDGDTFRVGRILLRFHCRPLAGSTRTEAADEQGERTPSRRSSLK
jgi:DNA-binding winged helix-turn-helix (wHTH) protein